MSYDNRLSRSVFVLFLFLAIIISFLLVIIVYWYLPVKILGWETTKRIYVCLAGILTVFLLADLFIFQPMRARDAKKNREKNLEKLGGYSGPFNRN